MVLGMNSQLSAPDVNLMKYDRVIKMDQYTAYTVQAIQYSITYADSEMEK